MTLARPHRTVLNFIWQGLSVVSRFCRSVHQRIQAQKQTRRMEQATITVTAQLIQPIASEPQSQPIEPCTLTPTEQETLQLSEQISCQMAELNNSSHSTEGTLDQPVQPEMSRSELVMALLDEAWERGITTYPQLIAYVAEQSGTGCSKRVVARWKRQRGLLDEAV